ncbi:hypothetical protein Tco_0324487 [Tanacetum coccineum]
MSVAVKVLYLKRRHKTNELKSNKSTQDSDYGLEHPVEKKKKRNKDVIGYPTIMRILRLERPADLPGTSNVIVEVVGV